MTQNFTAKTVEEAKALAARAFGAPLSEIQFEVLEEPKRSWFGVMKGQAIVRATYVSIDVSDRDRRVVESEIVKEEIVKPAPAEKPAPVETAASVAEPTPAAEPAPVEESAPAAEPTPAEEPAPAEEVTPAETSAPAEEAAPAETSAPAEESAPRKEKSAVETDEDLIAGEPSEKALEKIEAAKAYLMGVLKAMDIEAELEVRAGSESAMIDIIAQNSGAIIGRRGETLDALQYLTFMIANHSDREYYRIILNSAGYRERRRKTLEELAAKVAHNVLRSGRSTMLEPMNPYERRIIHSAVAGIEGVTSRSVGEEPYRKVVINSEDRSRRRRPARPDRSDSRYRNDRRRPRDRRRDDTPPERISMDSMKTSFEKDYKRPRPEDEINAGLYGKIEF